MSRESVGCISAAIVCVTGYMLQQAWYAGFCFLCHHSASLGDQIAVYTKLKDLRPIISSLMNILSIWITAWS